MEQIPAAIPSRSSLYSVKDSLKPREAALEKTVPKGDAKRQYPGGGAASHKETVPLALEVPAGPEKDLAASEVVSTFSVQDGGNLTPRASYRGHHQVSTDLLSDALLDGSSAFAISELITGLGHQSLAGSDLVVPSLFLLCCALSVLLLVKGIVVRSATAAHTSSTMNTIYTLNPNTSHAHQPTGFGTARWSADAGSSSASTAPSLPHRNPPAALPTPVAALYDPLQVFPPRCASPALGFEVGLAPRQEGTGVLLSQFHIASPENPTAMGAVCDKIVGTNWSNSGGYAESLEAGGDVVPPAVGQYEDLSKTDYGLCKPSSTERPARDPTDDLLALFGNLTLVSADDDSGYASSETHRGSQCSPGPCDTDSESDVSTLLDDAHSDSCTMSDDGQRGSEVDHAVGEEMDACPSSPASTNSEVEEYATEDAHRVREPHQIKAHNEDYDMMECGDSAAAAQEQQIGAAARENARAGPEAPPEPVPPVRWYAKELRDLLGEQRHAQFKSLFEGIGTEGFKMPSVKELEATYQGVDFTGLEAFVASFKVPSGPATAAEAKTEPPTAQQATDQLAAPSPTQVSRPILPAPTKRTLGLLPREDLQKMPPRFKPRTTQPQNYNPPPKRRRSPGEEPDFIRPAPYAAAGAKPKDPSAAYQKFVGANLTAQRDHAAVESYELTVARGDVIKVEAITCDLLVLGTIVKSRSSGWFPITVFSAAKSAAAPVQQTKPVEIKDEDRTAPYQKFIGRHLRVNHAFQGTTTSHLSLERGDVVKVLKIDSSLWTYGVDMSTNKSGWFPLALFSAAK